MVGLLALFAWGLTRDPKLIPTPRIGKEAPLLALELFDGRTFRLEEQRGKIVVLNVVGLLVLLGLLRGLTARFPAPIGWPEGGNAMKGRDDRERTRFVESMMVGVLAFSFLQLAASAAGLDTFQALPEAQQRPAPAFTLPDHQGHAVRLADLRGKVVVVRFWVTW